MQPEGAGGGPRGGERGLGGRPAGERAAGRPGGGAAATSRQGIFRILDPRAEFTHTHEPKYDLIPERLRGVDARGDALLSDDQLVGVAKGIEALDAGSGFLFEDGTGVGKTRELLAVAHTFASGGAPGGKKWKVLIVSKASAIEASKGSDGVWRPSGSYADDSAAMGIPIRYVRDRGPLAAGVIHLGTYHNLGDYKVDADTLLLLDEAHALKNSGDSEAASAGVELIRKAGRTVFATATPGDKPYHMAYLAPIGMLEGDDLETALKRLGCVPKPREKFSKAKFERLLAQGVPQTQARAQATEKILVWKSTNPRKTLSGTEALMERLTERGTVVKREVDLSSTDVRFSTVPLSAEGRVAMAEIENSKFNRRDSLMHMRRQQEPFKLQRVQDLTRAELAEGRQVVIFATRVNQSDVVERTKDPRTGDLIERIVMSSEGTLKQLREWLKAEGIPFAEIHGAAGESSRIAQERFQSGAARVVIASYEKGGTGINLDDRTGNAPRTMVMMTSPFDSVSVVQTIGRIHRFTTRSPSRVHMLFSDHEVDHWNAQILATKIRQLHAMVSGDIQLLDPSVLGGGEEALQSGVVHYKDAIATLSKVLGSSWMQGLPGQPNGIKSARHWGKIVRSLKDIGVKITLRGGEFEIPTHEGFLITGKIERGGVAAVGRRNIYGTARWDHDEEAGDLVKSIRTTAERAAPSGPPAASVLSKLRTIHNDWRPKQIVSKRQYDFHAAALAELGAVFGRGGKPGAFAVRTAEGETYGGELVPPLIRTEPGSPEGRAAGPSDYGAFWWKKLGADEGPALESVRAKYGERSRSLEDLIAAVETEGQTFRDFYERHQGVVRSLFGGDAPLFLRLLAVTAQATDIRGNVALALKAYRQLRHGTAFAGYMPTVKTALERIAADEPGYARGPKIRPYALALTNEDVDAIAVDRHVGRFMLGDAWTGTPAQVTHVQGLLLEASKILGWTGREMQSATWALSQIEQGLSPEEVTHYDEVLIERAAEIRRFRDYFGDVGGPGGWSGSALAALESRASSGERSSDPAFESRVLSAPGASQAFGGAVPVLDRPLLNWKRPSRAGTGFLLEPGRALPGRRGAKVAGATIREGFAKLGKIDWDGMWVGDVENSAAVFQTARNPSLEHLAFFVVMSDGTIGTAVQASSHSPTYVSLGPDDIFIKRLKSEMAGLETHGRTVKGLIGLHNHPSGNMALSDNDRKYYTALGRIFGAKWMGGVVIDHESATILPPLGPEYVIRRGPTAVEADPFLAAGVTAASYYDSESSLRILNADQLRGWANDMLAARLAGPGEALLIFADADQKLRLLATVPQELLMLPKALRRQITDAGRLAGASSVVVGLTAPDALVQSLGDQYVEEGLIQDLLVFGETKTAREQIMAERTSAWNRYIQPVERGGGTTRDRIAGDRPKIPDYLNWRELLAAEAADTRGFSHERYMAAGFHGMLDILSPRRGYGVAAKAERAMQTPPSEARGPELQEIGDAVRARGPIRPIPEPTPKDLVAMAMAMLAGERGEQVDWGRGKPTRVGRKGDLAINIHQMQDENGIREATVRVVRALDDVFRDIRTPQTVPQMRALALVLGLTDREFVALVKEHGAVRSSEIIAGHMLRHEAGLNFVSQYSEWSAAVEATRQLRERATAGEATDAEVAAAELAVLEGTRENAAAFHKFAGLMYATTGAASEGARALRAHGIMVGSLTAEERFFQKLFRGKNLDERQLAGLYEAIQRGDMADAHRRARALSKPGFLRMLIEYFINSLISAPPTIAANMMGNLFHEAGLRTPERGVAATLERFGVRQGIEKALTGKAEPVERVPGEMMAAWRAQAHARFGIFSALKLMWLAAGHEDIRFMQGVRGEYYPPAIPGLFGKIVRIPGRIMEAADLGARYSAMAAERAVQVWRRVYPEFADRGGYRNNRDAYRKRINEENDNLARWLDLEAERIANKEEFKKTHGKEGAKFLFEHRDFGGVRDAMERAGLESAFRDQTTRFTNFVKAARSTYPWLTFFVPFVSTVERIFVQALRRTPVGLARTLWNVREGKISGGLASDRIAQGVLGTMVSAAIYMMARDGLITGGGPGDPDERRNWEKTGKKPYAIKVGNTWISLARLEPLATTLGFAADLAEAQDEKVAGDIFDKLHYSVLNNITSKTYIEGMVSAAEAIGDPDRYGARLWKRMIGAAVPNLLATAARAIDPTIRQTDSISETLMARVPILSTTVPARLGGTGEPTIRGENAFSRFVSPFRYSEEAGPEANLERLFLETGYNPASPPRELSIPGALGRKIALTAAERRIYSAYAGRATAFARQLAARDDWGSLDVYAKEEVLKRIYRFTHDAARRDVWRSITWRAGAGDVKLAVAR